MKKITDLRAHFYSRVEPCPTTGCWLWTGTVGSNGYGQLWFDGKQRRAHRTAWVLHVGEPPPGLDVCHHCDVPLCVNPRHLFLGTPSDNMLDCSSKGRIGRLLLQRVAIGPFQDGNYFVDRPKMRGTFVVKHGRVVECVPDELKRRLSFWAKHARTGGKEETK